MFGNTSTWKRFPSCHSTLLPNGPWSSALTLVDNVAPCDSDFVTYLHGTKCAAQFSGPVHRSIVHTYKGQRLAKDEITWQADGETCHGRVLGIGADGGLRVVLADGSESVLYSGDVHLGGTP